MNFFIDKCPLIPLWNQLRKSSIKTRQKLITGDIDTAIIYLNISYKYCKIRFSTDAVISGYYIFMHKPNLKKIKETLGIFVLIYIKKKSLQFSVNIEIQDS